MKKYIKEKKIKRDILINNNILDFATEHFNKEYPDAVNMQPIDLNEILYIKWWSRTTC